MPLTPQYDLSITDSAYDVDETLKTRVTISLLSWARAQPGDVVPDASDLKGWWGDTYASEPGDVTGSRIWTLIGQPITKALLAKLDGFIRESVQWILDEGIATELSVDLEVISEHMIGAKLSIRRPKDATLTQLDVWNVSLASG